MGTVETPALARGRVRHMLALAVGMMLLFAGAFVVAPPSTAHANIFFCTGVRLGPAGGGSAGCHDPNSHFLRVVDSFSEEGPSCAEALFTEGAQTGNILCSARRGEAGFVTFSGTTLLLGRIANPSIRISIIASGISEN